jgi:hypothetical protein
VSTEPTRCLGQPMNRFWSFLTNSYTLPGKLPLTHTTDVYCFRQIREFNQLIPSECPVYKGSNLLYFFYGRPSYRPHPIADTVSARSLLPVCLVMSSELSKLAIRCMPFDSGAFDRKMMHPPMHPQMCLKDFEITLAPNAPMQLIQTFYGSESQYYNARPLNEVGAFDEYDDLEVDSYVRLLRYRSNSQFDDRVTAIELQLDQPVCLHHKVLAVIVPKPYLDMPGIAEQIDSWDAVALPYNVKEEFIPRECHGSIFDRLTQFLIDEGLLEMR